MTAEVNISDIFDGSNSGQGENVFPCFCCGICCNDYQPHLELTESQVIADHLKVSLQKFLADVLIPAGREPTPIYCYKKTESACSWSKKTRALPGFAEFTLLNRMLVVNGRPAFRKKNAVEDLAFTGDYRLMILGK